MSPEDQSPQPPNPEFEPPNSLGEITDLFEALLSDQINGSDMSQKLLRYTEGFLEKHWGELSPERRDKLANMHHEIRRTTSRDR